jgi:DNA-binding NtrC family response regulator
LTHPGLAIGRRLVDNYCMGRILVIDDDEDVLDALQFYLSRGGHQVVTAPSGEQALAALHEQEFDLVITDLRMPGMDGLATVEALRTVAPNVKVIVVTGFTQGETAEACERLQVAATLRKPFALSELEKIVSGALQAP